MSQSTIPTFNVNPDLLASAIIASAALAKAAGYTSTKRAFLPGDPNGGAPGTPPADPSAGGGAGGDPSAGMAPPAPAPAPMQPAMQQAVEPIKPKIDVNVTMLQILKILAKIADALGVPIPASEMVATQSDLTNMGMQQQNGAPVGGQQQSAIPPIQPMPAAAPGMGKTSDDDLFSIEDREGSVFDVAAMDTVSVKAAAIAQLQQARQRRSA